MTTSSIPVGNLSCKSYPLGVYLYYRFFMYLRVHPLGITPQKCRNTTEQFARMFLEGGCPQIGAFLIIARVIPATELVLASQS
jgi:hypothetical protein